MSFAFLPLYTGDYRRDTQHLTPLKHGIFLLLLMHCWDTKGPAPLDEQECAGIANCRSADEIDALRYVLGRFFTRMDDGHYNKRIHIEIERAEAVSRARSEAGRKGYQAFAKQVRGKSSAIAEQVPITPTPTLTLTPIKEKTKSKSTARLGTRLADDWKIPEDWIDLGLAVHPDWTRAGVFREAITFRDYWCAKPGKEATKVDWLRVWRTWIRRTESEPQR